MLNCLAPDPWKILEWITTHVLPSWFLQGEMNKNSCYGSDPQEILEPCKVCPQFCWDVGSDC